MSDKPWKQFERWVAERLGGRRFWANSGETIDTEGPIFVAQCKLVRQLSLEQLTALAMTAHEQGKKKDKVGIVIVKLSGHRGNLRRPALFVLHEDAWMELHGPAARERETNANQANI